LDAKYSSWLDAKTAEVAKLPFWEGGWYVAGPYKAASANRGLAEPYVSERKPST